MFSPVCSEENGGFTFQISSFYFIFWILLSPWQSHLAAPQHCQGHSCVKSEQKVQGTFSIIRITPTFTPGNLSQLGYEQQGRLDISFVVAGRFHGISFITSLNWTGAWKTFRESKNVGLKKKKINNKTLSWWSNENIWNRKKTNI